MYTFSKRLKIASFILMAVGALCLISGFLSAPSTVEEAKEMVAAHGDGHGDSHGEESAHSPETSHAMGAADASEHSTEGEHANEHSAAHDEHVFHQLQNRPWSALYVAAFFFFMISLGALAFYAVNRAAQAGWAPL
ncbi:MAG: quinol:cytochrome C oxidoreductase, partial [Croceitalea sp.]|nr:quinol:cytochrome C oxidoreductase [Croceitalea sp.]